MATETEVGGDAVQNPTGETSAKRSGAKKSDAKKSSAKKSGVKKTARKTAAKKSAAKKSSAKRAAGGATARRQAVKAEEERAQYLIKIEANESRLRDGKTSNDQPLSPEQIKTTQDILARQREHLAELETYVGATSEDPRT